MITKLENIGFYTLTDKRAREASSVSIIKRAEIVLTDRCNFKCPYCRGVMDSIKGQLSLEKLQTYLNLLIDNGLENVRFTGGEPTLYGGLVNAVAYCSLHGVKRIALSTNGTASMGLYNRLVDNGVNDFSISLDGGCCAVGDIMSGGVKGAWDKVVSNIKALSKISYVSIGMVFTEVNIDQCVESVRFVADLGVSDIRIIPSAQYNKALTQLKTLPSDILERYPILKYRIGNIKDNVHVRGIQSTDNTQCPLVLDDLAIAGNYHFPCVIYMREQGQPIGEMNQSFRQQRLEWYENHNTHLDNICQTNCLDVCREYNNKFKYFKES